MRTSGRAIVIFAMPGVRAGGLLVADVGVGAGRRAARRVQVRSSARRLACAPCSSRHGSRARRRGARTARRSRRPAGSWTYARAARRRARRRRRSSRARGAGPGDAGRDRAAGRAWRSRRRCTRACCSGRSRCRSTCASAPAERERIAGGRALRRGRAAARPQPRARGARAGVRRATTSTRSRSSSTPRARPRRRRPVELTYGNLLWSALGSAVALGIAPRRALAVRAAALPRRRPLDPDAQRDLRDDRGRARALRDRSRAARAARRERITLVSLVATTLARLLDAGLQRPPRCAARSPAAARCRPRCASARSRPGCR